MLLSLLSILDSCDASLWSTDQSPSLVHLGVLHEDLVSSFSRVCIAHWHFFFSLATLYASVFTVAAANAEASSPWRTILAAFLDGALWAGTNRCFLPKAGLFFHGYFSPVRRDCYGCASEGPDHSWWVRASIVIACIMTPSGWVSCGYGISSSRWLCCIFSFWVLFHVFVNSLSEHSRPFQIENVFHSVAVHTTDSPFWQPRLRTWRGVQQLLHQRPE